jgi:glycerophosphoryl diester phosphodiesterase
VVWHDAEIDNAKCGLADGAPPDLPDPDNPLIPDEQLMVRNLTSEDLSWYRCDRNPDAARYPDQDATPTALAGDDWSIITLDALFDFVAAYAESPQKSEAQRAAASVVRFNIETKRKPDRPETIGDGFDGSTAGPFELAILAIVTDRAVTDRVVIQSFDHRSLWAIASINPAIELAALSTTEAVDYEDLASRGASIWSPNQNAVNADTLTRAHAAGLDVIPWTVNDRKDMEGLIALGVDGIITDRPDILVDLMGAN